jgi:hypothetical protein
MRGTIPALPQYVSTAWCLVKHRDNFTFLPFTSLDKGLRCFILEDTKLRKFHKLILQNSITNDTDHMQHASMDVPNSEEKSLRKILSNGLICLNDCDPQEHLNALLPHYPTQWFHGQNLSLWN